MILLDIQRKKGWRPIGISIAFYVAVSSALFGVIIEYIQKAMNIGRGYETADILADSIGAFLFPLCWWLFQRYWIPNFPDNKENR